MSASPPESPRAPIIHPSPAIVVRADTPMEECIHLMQRHRVGSLLVVNDVQTQELIGIFTERDLLQKLELIDKGGFWDKPVRTVMSHPVKVVRSDQLHQAADVMLKEGIRHLPIVAAGSDGNRLVGVISMRDVFASIVRSQARTINPSRPAAAPKPPPKLRTAPIGVITADPHMIQFLKDTLAYAYHVGVKHLSVDDVRDESERPNLLIFDLDRLQPHEWVKTLKSLNQRFRPPLTVVVYDPSLYDVGTLEALDKLSSAQEFVVFSKPLSVAALMERIGPTLGAHSEPE